MTPSTNTQELRATLHAIMEDAQHNMTALPDPRAWAILAVQQIEALVRKAEQKPVGAALEIKVASETMQAVMARIKMTDKNIADRVIEPVWRIERWRAGTGDEFDYEIELWRLRILGRLTRRFNWSAFLLKPDNLDVLRTKAQLKVTNSKQDKQT